MKKRVQGDKLGKSFVLLIILVAASLIVDLASLNTLYALSPQAEECIDNECDDPWEDCYLSTYYDVLDEVFNEVYEDCVRSHTVTEGYYYSYILPSDIEACQDEAEDAAVAAASDAYDACVAVSNWCQENCDELWPEGGYYEDPEPDPSGSSCDGNADCPSTACFDSTRLFTMACISGTCDYGHRIETCQYGCSEGACNLS